VEGEVFAFPVSFAQQRLWFLDQLEPSNPAYNIFQSLSLVGQLDRAALERSLNDMVQRHESLRTTFAAVDGEPQQVIHLHLRLPVQFVDLTALSEPERVLEARSLASAEAQRPFDLSRGPLLRANLLRLGAEEHVLVLIMHHIVSDGWSMGLFSRELAALYGAYSAGLPSPLAELPIQYADYAVWQRAQLQGEQLERELEYWRRQLAGVPARLKLPTSSPREERQTFSGAHQKVTIDAEVTLGLRGLARRESATLFMVLVAAYVTLLYHYTSQADIAIGTPVAGRNRLELEGLIGFSVNTLVLRTNLSSGMRFVELLRVVREVCLEAYAHQEVPFEKVVEELQPERDPSHSPLFNVMFVLQNIPTREEPDPDRNCTTFEITFKPGFGIERRVAKYDLTVALAEHSEHLSGVIEYRSDLLEAATIGRLIKNFKVLVEDIIANPTKRLSDLTLLTASERHEQLVTCNRTKRDDFAERSVVQLFEEQAAKSPQAPAFFYGDGWLSYAELNRRANLLARHLCSLGVKPEMTVGLCLERSLDLTVALLGILKTGAAYLPLEPSYPKKRLTFMLENAAVTVLLTREKYASLAKDQAATVCTDRDAAVIAQHDGANPGVYPAADNMAYVIFTSGSTGQPKGIAVDHRQLLNRFMWMWEAYPFQPGELCCQRTALSFVDSIWELFGPLLRGVPTVIIPPEVTIDPVAFVKILATRGVTRIWVIPSLLGLLLDTFPDLQQRLLALKFWVTSGEPLTTELFQKFQTLMPTSVLYNLYGTSEVWDATWHDPTLSKHPASGISIGRPITNTEAYIFDEHWQLRPIGVVGELYIGGAGLARGYLHRPDLTAERFIPHPYGQRGGERLYRTGDLARLSESGEVEFIGRADYQVKVRGYRVELAEVETVLRKHGGVSEAVVLAEGRGSDQQLVAYLVTHSSLSAATLRRFLRQRLPEYMLPSRFCFIAKLPLTPNGKVDRLALRASQPLVHETQVDSLGAPQTDVERHLANVWAEVLGIASVGREDNFFELGGHSLLAARVVARMLTRHGVELPLRAFFNTSTLAELAEQTSGIRYASLNPQVRRREHEGPCPLSFSQQRLWFLDQLEPGNVAYNLAKTLRLKGPLNIVALERSLIEIVRRHESLRTWFKIIDGQPVQIIEPCQPPGLIRVDLPDSGSDERELKALQLITEVVQRPFDLRGGPLLRASLLKLGSAEHMLVLVMHHIVSDGWSMGIFSEELAALYAAYCAGGESPLEELPIQYADYALWQREYLSGESLATDLSYWKQQLADLPQQTLVTDFPRPETASFHGARHLLRLSADATNRLKARRLDEGVTLFMLLLASFKAFLHSYTNAEDIVVGSSTAGRHLVETERLIGFFVNTLVLRTNLAGNPSFSELLKRTREVSLEAHVHQHLPFDRLVEELRPKREVNRTPLYQVQFAFQNAPQPEWQLADLIVEPLNVDIGATHFDLVANLWAGRDGLCCLFNYNTDLFRHETIVRISAGFEAILSRIGTGAADRLSDLRKIVVEAERQQIASAAGELKESTRGRLRSAKRRVVRL